MNYICVQPDKPMFVWQLKVLLNSLQKLGVSKENIFFPTLLEGREEPSLEFRKLEKFANVCYYHEREEFKTNGRYYVPSSKPYLYGRFFEQYDYLLKGDFFYVESDMLIHEVPALQIKEGTYYWSDASQWLEVNKYEKALGYPNDPTSTSFGFHCIGKGIPSEIWYQIEKDSNDLYKWFVRHSDPKDNIWICEMRAWMWNMKKHFTNIVSEELNFNHGRGIKEPYKLHHQLDNRVFRKRDYETKEPWDINLEVDTAFSLHDYIEAIKETGKSFFNL